MAKSIQQVSLQDLVNTGLTAHDAKVLHAELNDVIKCINGSSPVEIWCEITNRKLLKPFYPDALHLLVYNKVYGGYDVSVNGPAPYWFPN